MNPYDAGFKHWHTKMRREFPVLFTIKPHIKKESFTAEGGFGGMFTVKCWVARKEHYRGYGSTPQDAYNALMLVLDSWRVKL